ncbi:hypothetical protein [Silvanigrella sp.]|jgi:hypothetical protein|uniref:hypothetical protein n=1 Tax=Silvanigrella sp. TaxID=2024976 RepID=UPI0037C80DE4
MRTFLPKLPDHLYYLSSIHKACENETFDNWLEVFENTVIKAILEKESGFTETEAKELFDNTEQHAINFVNLLARFLCEQQAGNKYWNEQEWLIYLKPVEDTLAKEARSRAEKHLADIPKIIEKKTAINSRPEYNLEIKDNLVRLKKIN